MKRNITLLLLLLIATFGTATYAQCPPNIDFELGTTGMWNYFVGTCCPINTPTATSAISNRHTLTSGTSFDPYGLFPVVAPGGGSYSMRLGNDSVGADAEKARYYVRVPASSSSFSLVYRYAMVLENPSSHSSAEQPRFEVKAYDSASGAAVPCAQFSYISSSTLPGFRLSTRASTYFRDWTTATINLTGLGGRTIAVDFASGDCSLGGHFGYGYLDMTCGLFAVIIISCDTTYATCTAPDGFMRYQWFDSSFTTAYDTTQVATLPISSVPRTYAVVITPYTGYGCPDTLYTLIIPSHLELHPTRDTTLCASTAIVLTSGATDRLPITGYSWRPATGLSCTTCANPVATPTVTTTYTVTAYDSGGCSRSATIRIQIGGITAVQSHTDVRCYGDTTGTAVVTPTRGVPPFHYRWTTSPPRYTQSVTGLAAGTYTVFITDTGTCAGVQVITINQPPPLIQSITARNSPTTCGGTDGSIALSGFTPGGSYTLSYIFGGSTRTASLTASGSGIVTITGLSAGIYDSIMVLGTGCPYNVAGPVTLTDPPPPPAPAIVSPTYCQYDVASALSATGTGTILWYGPGGVSGSTTAPTPTTATPHIDTYYVTQTVANCVSPRERIFVTVIAKPAPPVVLDTVYCQFDSAVALTATGRSLAWYNVPVGGTALPGAPRPNTAIVGNTTWFVSQTVNGCTSDRSPINANVLYLPDFTITPSNTFVCQHDTLHLAYTGLSLIDPDYLWELGVGQSFITGSATTPEATVRFDSVLFQTVKLTASNYHGRCHTTKQINIPVVPEPHATTYIKENICVGDTVVMALRYRSSNADHYVWNFDGATIISKNYNTGGPYKIKYTTTGAHIITLNAITAEGCAGPNAYDTVKVMPLPDASILVHTLRGKVCIEDSMYLTTADSNNVRNTYTWNPAHFFDNGKAPKAWGRIEAPGFVTLNVMSEFGCRNTDSVWLSPETCCTVIFPNAFTPNGDGNNDYFKPIMQGYHRFSVFRITNRWGQTVYETTNNNLEWDGTFNGVPQDLGVYFYFVKFDCGGNTQIEKGEVLLMR